MMYLRLRFIDINVGQPSSCYTATSYKHCAVLEPMLDPFQRVRLSKDWRKIIPCSECQSYFRPNCLRQLKCFLLERIRARKYIQYGMKQCQPRVSQMITYLLNFKICLVLPDTGFYLFKYHMQNQTLLVHKTKRK